MFFKSSVFGLKIQENIQKKLAVSLKKTQQTGISQNRSSASQLTSQNPFHLTLSNLQMLLKSTKFLDGRP